MMLARIGKAAGFGSGGSGAAGGEPSRIGAEAVISGDIETSGRLAIDGKVIGNIRCAGLSQSESGAVHGNIVAEEAKLAGLVDGGVEAGSLILDATARITGDVIYETLSVARGAEVEGRFRRRRQGDHGSLGIKAAKAEEGPLFAAPIPAATLAAE
jgi:cytoskeletal protein CcmA (bactofilin family)